MRLLIVISFLIFMDGLKGQSDSTTPLASPTTLEEYNYLTKGYHIQITSGLDMKKGYRLDTLGAYSLGNYNFAVLKLSRDIGNQMAGTLVIAEGKTTGKDYYAAIPINNSDLMKLYHDSVSKWPKDLLVDYTQLLAIYLSAYVKDRHVSGKE
jgi:hypothetical protein